MHIKRWIRYKDFTTKKNLFELLQYNTAKYDGSFLTKRCFLHIFLNLISVEIAIQHTNRPWKQSFVYEHHFGKYDGKRTKPKFLKTKQTHEKEFCKLQIFFAKGNECKFKTYTQSDFALWYDYCSNLRHRKTWSNRSQNMIFSTRFIYRTMYNNYLLSFNFEQTFAFRWLTIVFMSGTFLAEKENFVVYNSFHDSCVLIKSRRKMLRGWTSISLK